MRIGNSDFELGGKAWCSGMYCHRIKDSCGFREVAGVVVPENRAIDLKMPIVRVVAIGSNMAIICGGDCGDNDRITFDTLDNRMSLVRLKSGE